jgi:hypothetical protein
VEELTNETFLYNILQNFQKCFPTFFAPQFLPSQSFCVIKLLFNEIGIRVGHDRVKSALDAIGTLQKK